MTDLQKLTEWFKAQVGVTEQGSNNVKYNTDYYGAPVQGDNYPWCCAFIWDGFHQTGLSRLFCGGAKTAYCPYVQSYARSHNQWIEGNYKHGDLLLYDWNADGVPDHIGFCLSWNGTSAVAIEGNADNAVKEITRYPVSILGAYRPEYTEEEKTADKGTGVYIVKAGDSLWSIAEKLLGDPWRYHEIEEANNLKNAMIYIGQKLIINGAADDVTFSVTLPADVYEKLVKLSSGNINDTIARMVENE